MKREDRATISVSKNTHANFEKYRAKLNAKRGKSPDIGCFVRLR
jgi:hypothetical protein